MSLVLLLQIPPFRIGKLERNTWLKKDIWVLPSLIPLWFLEHFCVRVQWDHQVFTLICAVLLLKQEQEEHGHHTSPSPLLFLGLTCSLQPKPAQNKSRSNWIHLWYCVWGKLCWFFIFFNYILLLQTEWVGHWGGELQTGMGGDQQNREHQPDPLTGAHSKSKNTNLNLEQNTRKILLFLFQIDPQCADVFQDDCVMFYLYKNECTAKSSKDKCQSHCHYQELLIIFTTTPDSSQLLPLSRSSSVCLWPNSWCFSALAQAQSSPTWRRKKSSCGDIHLCHRSFKVLFLPCCQGLWSNLQTFSVL